jgi:hypothetical protein
MSQQLRWMAVGSAFASALIGLTLGVVLPGAQAILTLGLVSALLCGLLATESTATA